MGKITLEIGYSFENKEKIEKVLGFSEKVPLNSVAIKKGTTICDVINRCFNDKKIKIRLIGDTGKFNYVYNKKEMSNLLETPMLFVNYSNDYDKPLYLNSNLKPDIYERYVQIILKFSGVIDEYDLLIKNYSFYTHKQKVI